MTDTYDVVILGGGHNGLTTAAYLAGAGCKVVVLEKNGTVGGAASTEEFAPGFRNSVASYTVSLLNPQVIQDLDLPRHGDPPGRRLRDAGLDAAVGAYRHLHARQGQHVGCGRECVRHVLGHPGRSWAGRDPHARPGADSGRPAVRAGPNQRLASTKEKIGELLDDFHGIVS